MTFMVLVRLDAVYCYSWECLWRWQSQGSKDRSERVVEEDKSEQ